MWFSFILFALSHSGNCFHLTRSTLILEALVQAIWYIVRVSTISPIWQICWNIWGFVCCQRSHQTGAVRCILFDKVSASWKTTLIKVILARMRGHALISKHSSLRKMAVMIPFIFSFRLNVLVVNHAFLTPCNWNSCFRFNSFCVPVYVAIPYYIPFGCDHGCSRRHAQVLLCVYANKVLLRFFDRPKFVGSRVMVEPPLRVCM